MSSPEKNNPLEDTVSDPSITNKPATLDSGIESLPEVSAELDKAINTVHNELQAAREERSGLWSRYSELISQNDPSREEVYENIQLLDQTIQELVDKEQELRAERAEYTGTSSVSESTVSTPETFEEYVITLPDNPKLVTEVYNELLAAYEQMNDNKDDIAIRYKYFILLPLYKKNTVDVAVVYTALNKREKVDLDVFSAAVDEIKAFIEQHAHDSYDESSIDETISNIEVDIAKQKELKRLEHLKKELFPERYTPEKEPQQDETAQQPQPPTKKEVLSDAEGSSGEKKMSFMEKTGRNTAIIWKRSEPVIKASLSLARKGIAIGWNLFSKGLHRVPELIEKRKARIETQRNASAKPSTKGKQEHVSREYHPSDLSGVTVHPRDEIPTVHIPKSELISAYTEQTPQEKISEERKGTLTMRDPAASSLFKDNKFVVQHPQENQAAAIESDSQEEGQREEKQPATTQEQPPASIDEKSTEEPRTEAIRPPRSSPKVLMDYLNTVEGVQKYIDAQKKVRDALPQEIRNTYDLEIRLVEKSNKEKKREGLARAIHRGLTQTRDNEQTRASQEIQIFSLSRPPAALTHYLRTAEGNRVYQETQQVLQKAFPATILENYKVEIGLKKKKRNARK